MIEIIPVIDKETQRQFVEFQYQLYETCPQFTRLLNPTFI